MGIYNHLRNGYTFSWKGNEWALTGFKPSPTEKNRNFIEKNLPEWYRDSLNDLKQKLGIKPPPPVVIEQPIEEVPDPEDEYLSRPIFTRDNSQVLGDGLTASRRKINPAAVPDETDPPAPDTNLPAGKQSDEISYTFARYSETEGWSLKHLWAYKIETGNIVVPLEIYDAVYEAKDDVLVTVFRQGGVLRANVVSGNEQKGRTGMEWADTELKLLEINSKTLASAKIGGTIEDNSLRLLLRSTDGSKRATFVLQNGQWKQVDDRGP